MHEYITLDKRATKPLGSKIDFEWGAPTDKVHAFADRTRRDRRVSDVKKAGEEAAAVAKGLRTPTDARRPVQHSALLPVAPGILPDPQANSRYGKDGPTCRSFWSQCSDNVAFL